MFHAAETEGLRFECTGCAYCCGGGPGYVWLTRSDIEALSRVMRMPEDKFLSSFCRKIDSFDGVAYSLLEKENFDCVFLASGRCSVYEARPVQCRTYPFWPDVLSGESTWDSEASHCPGIGKGRLVPPGEIAERFLAMRVAESGRFCTAGGSGADPENPDRQVGLDAR